MTTTEQAKYKCESWTHRGGSSFGSTCGNPAPTFVEVKYEWQHGVRSVVGYEPRCNFHASVIRRHAKSYGAPDPTEVLTPEIEKIIDKRLAATRKRIEDERAAKQVDSVKRAEVAKVRAAEEQAVEWQIIREDDTEYPYGRPAAELKRVPRWYIRAVTDARGWDQAEVKLSDHYGQTILEVRNSSQLTPNAAKALIEALTAALKEVES